MQIGVNMLNIIWPMFIMISYIYAICFGHIEEVNNEIFNSANNAVNISINLLRKYVFVVWIDENSAKY